MPVDVEAYYELQMAVATLFAELLDQYKIEELSVEKRYTDMYEAFDVDENQTVLIDILRPPYARDAAFAGRFYERGRALAQIHHPNIARVLGLGSGPDQRPYVSQAYLDGHPLTERLHQLGERSTLVNSIYALKLVRQLAEALQLAERLNMLHYDLQPDNVWLKNVALPSDDTVVLRDLFVPYERARLKPRDEDEALRLAYLSPEQRKGRMITASSHAYSLGVILHRLLTGSLPPGPVRRIDVAWRGLFGRPSSLGRERPDLSPKTVALVDRCLRNDPGQRFESIEQLIAAIDGALAAEELRVGLVPGQPAGRSRRGAWGLVLGLLLVGMLALVTAMTMETLRGGLLPALAGPGQALSELVSPVTPASTAGEAIPPPAATDGGEPAPADGGAGESAAVVVPTATTEPSPTAGSAEVIVAPASATDTPEPAATLPPTGTATPTPTATAAPTDSPTATAEPTPEVRIVLNAVNLRRGPGLAFDIIDRLESGDLARVIARIGDDEDSWLLVETIAGIRGWLSATVVEPVNGLTLASLPMAATVPPTPFFTPTPTATPTIIAVTETATPESSDGGGGGGGGGTPTSAAPTEPAQEPTLTPPPLP